MTIITNPDGTTSVGLQVPRTPSVPRTGGEQSQTLNVDGVVSTTPAGQTPDLAQPAVIGEAFQLQAPALLGPVPPPTYTDGSQVPSIPAGYYPRAIDQEDEYAPSDSNGGVPPSESASGGRVEWGQATPPSSLTSIKEGLKALGFSDSQIAKLTDEEIEDGVSKEEYRRMEPDVTKLSDMAINLLSRGGLGVNALGGVAADEDGTQLADIQRFLTEVVAPLVSGTGKSLEVIARFLRANKFRVISRHAAARAFRESTREKEGLWTTTDGTTTLSVKTLIDKYVRGELKGLAGKVLANILGHEISETDRLTEDQLANFFLTMYFVAKSDSPENIMSEAKDMPELEGDSPAKLIEWLTKGAENPVRAEGSSQTGGPAQSSSESRVISGNIAATTVINSALSLTTGADPNFVKAIKILNLAIDENIFMRPIEDETGIHEVEYTLEIDEEGRRELLAARETAITRMVIGEEEVVKGILDQLLEKRDFEGALALLRSALAGSVEIEGQAIAFEVTAELKNKFTRKLAEITLQLAGSRLLDQGDKLKSDVSTEDYNVAIKYLLEVQTLSVEYPGILEESRIRAGQTLMAMAIFGLSKSGGALNSESLEQLKAEIISGAQDGGFREYVRMQALAEPAGRNPLSLDDAMLMRWKRVYVARIDALISKTPYAYYTAIVPNMTDSTGNDGWFEIQTSSSPPPAFPPAFGEEATVESTPAAHSSPRPPREHRELPTERATPPAPQGGRFAERVSQISDQRVRTAVTGWSEDKQKSFFQRVDNLRQENPDISARDAERQAFTWLSLN